MYKFKVMTNGKFEGLNHISNDKGLFTIVATDQRGSLKRMINPGDPDSVTIERARYGVFRTSDFTGNWVMIFPSLVTRKLAESWVAVLH